MVISSTATARIRFIRRAVSAVALAIVSAARRFVTAAWTTKQTRAPSGPAPTPFVIVKPEKFKFQQHLNQLLKFNFF